MAQAVRRERMPMHPVDQDAATGAFAVPLRINRTGAESPHPAQPLNGRSPMPAYIIVLADVTDPEQYAQYTKVTPSVVAHFGGRFVARGGRTETLEGPPETRRVVLIEF